MIKTYFHLIYLKQRKRKIGMNRKIKKVKSDYIKEVKRNETIE